MRFSLVLATVGRTNELSRFLQFLDTQTYCDFELILVNQNPDDRLAPILNLYDNHFPVIHLRSARGLSHARNVGLKHITGDIVAFPDDDCWYPPDLLNRVVCFFTQHPDLDGLSVRIIGEDGKDSLLRWPSDSDPLTPFNALRRVVSHGLFLKRLVVESVGEFDEDLGVGAGTPWGAGEETDYVLRALKKGFRIYYKADLALYHPHRVHRYDQRAWRKATLYGKGAGRVLKKHKYPVWFVIYLWLRLVAGIFTDLARGNYGKTLYRWFSLKGSIVGWVASIKKTPQDRL